MTSLNFEFLSRHSSTAADIMALAEKYAPPDPRASVVKGREFAELCVEYIYAVRHYPRPFNASLNVLLNEGLFVQTTPRIMRDHFHLLRKLGNRGAHRELNAPPVTHKDALNSLNRAWHLARWMFIEHMAILDKADEIRRKRAETIRLTEELLKSAFLEMFGDPVTNPKGWEVRKLGDLCTKITDGTHKTPTYTDDGVPFLSAKNLRGGVLDWENTKFISRTEHDELIKRCKPEKGDILLAKSGTIGTAVEVNRNTEFSAFESLAVLKRRAELRAKFLTQLLNSHAVRQLYERNSKGVGVKHLHLVDIRNLDIIYPPAAEQARFEDAVAAIETKTVRLNKSSDLALKMSSALTQRAFRGEL